MNLLNFWIDLIFVLGCSVTYFPNRKSLGYTDLWQLCIEHNDGEKCSFSIGRQLNFLKENSHCGFIEFNPNKCMQFFEFQSFFEAFMQLCTSFDLVRYDCAIDLPIPRKQVKMIRTSRCNYEYLCQSPKDDKELNKTDKEGLLLNTSVTEYQGRRNKNKFTKLYDKTKESKLDYDLTRIEFTFDRAEVEFKNLPQFYIYDFKVISHSNEDFAKLSQNDLVFVDLLRNSEDINYYLKNLTYRFRKKIEPFLNDLTFVPDYEKIKSVRDLALYFEI